MNTALKLQANQQAENEKINTLEHSTTEHKNLKQPLQALLDLLEKMKIKMLDQKERLPGSICLAAAVCGYCGCLGTTERLALISYVLVSFFMLKRGLKSENKCAKHYGYGALIAAFIWENYLLITCNKFVNII